jgi:mannose/cellobiose epimerase-like protein (N-acyl-D-glucosamine 2-epimerase family)
LTASVSGSGMDFPRLRQLYKELLLEDIAPFWLKHGVDWQHDGVLSCMDDAGSVLSGDKYIWSQARSVWTFSALYNRVEKNPEFLKIAANSVRFLLAHGRDAQGRWAYHVSREGEIIEGAISIYSDCFVVYGLSEYLRAVPNPDILSVIWSAFRSHLPAGPLRRFSRDRALCSSAGTQGPWRLDDTHRSS